MFHNDLDSAPPMRHAVQRVLFDSEGIHLLQAHLGESDSTIFPRHLPHVCVENVIQNRGQAKLGCKRKRCEPVLIEGGERGHSPIVYEPVYGVELLVEDCHV